MKKKKQFNGLVIIITGYKASILRLSGHMIASKVLEII